jgi:hypothetical protein
MEIQQQTSKKQNTIINQIKTQNPDQKTHQNFQKKS